MVNVYHQLYTEEWQNGAGRLLFCRRPILWAIFTEAVNRAWRWTTPNNLRLEQWEFMFSKSEFNKFWLKKSQANQICTALNTLQKESYLEDTGKRIGRQKSAVYKLLPNKILMPIWLIGNVWGNDSKKIGSEVGTNKENTNKEKKKSVKDNTPFISDDSLLQLILSFKNDSYFTKFARTGNDKSDISYLKKIYQDQKNTNLILEKLKVSPENIEDTIKIILKSVILVLRINSFWEWKLSSMKDIYNNLWKIINDFLIYLSKKNDRTN